MQKYSPETPKTINELIQIIRMDKSTGQMRSYDQHLAKRDLKPCVIRKHLNQPA